jgi:hypothetical protein
MNTTNSLHEVSYLGNYSTGIFFFLSKDGKQKELASVPYLVY